MSENTQLNEEISKMSFRQAMEQLDKTVASLENNSMELEDSLKAYERGVALLANLQGRLGTAQQKIEQLMGNFDIPADYSAVDKSIS